MDDYCFFDQSLVENLLFNSLQHELEDPEKIFQHHNNKTNPDYNANLWGQQLQDYHSEEKPHPEILTTKKKKPKLKFIKKDSYKISARSSPKKSQKGNKNLVKFLIKSFFKHAPLMLEEKDEDYESFIISLKNKTYEKDRKKHNTSDLHHILMNKQEGSDKFFKKNREIMAKILTSAEMREDIIHSKFIRRIKDKKQKLIAVKVFALRCKNSDLVLRLQTR